MIKDLISKRTSVRKFKNEKISEEDINEIIDTARFSPSGGNEQSWKFGIITDAKLIKTISEISYNQKWIETSPLLIILCTVTVEDNRGARNIQTSRFPEYKKDITSLKKELYDILNSEEHQTKIPGTMMMLTALEKGIYSTWVSYFKVKELSALLELPNNIIPSEILVLGYPNEEINYRKKKEIVDVTFRNKYREA